LKQASEPWTVKLYDMPEIRMGFVFGEDGSANSSGAETVFRTDATRYPHSRLCRSVAGYHFLKGDHFQVGKGGRPGRRANVRTPGDEAVDTYLGCFTTNVL